MPAAWLPSRRRSLLRGVRLANRQSQGDKRDCVPARDAIVNSSANSRSGMQPVPNTIGMSRIGDQNLWPAAAATSGATGPYAKAAPSHATITSGLSFTISAAVAGRSSRVFAERSSNLKLAPSTQPRSRRPCTNASREFGGSPLKSSQRRTTVGIRFACCASAENGASARLTARTTASPIRRMGISGWDGWRESSRGWTIAGAVRPVRCAAARVSAGPRAGNCATPVPAKSHPG